MKIEVIPVGMLQCNCYVVSTSKKNAVVIDPGADAKKILKYLSENELKLEKILLTHAHFDHIGAVTALKEKTNAALYCNAEDEEWLLNPSLIGKGFFSDFSGYTPEKQYINIDDNDEITIDELTIKVLHTKGHSKGSCCFVVENILFSGDTLFKQSAGRTDLYGGSTLELMQSMKKLKEIKEDLKVMPGHGDFSALNFEKYTNPYLQV